MNSNLENALNHLFLAKEESESLSFDQSRILEKAIETVSALLAELEKDEEEWTPPTPYDFSIADLLIDACENPVNP
ncbi:hypothetical protein V0288_23730 [Pannus brasiliensis CCIBt3594]|uniref:Uncharacterized protein n=1 Tax=Pannus brasiliensis CCIBt3594 TaxID=1427578 RepID=A0AAW9QZZ1_9CHRO